MMADKLIIDCTNEIITEANFTTEEIAQREYEANLPKPVQPPSVEDRIKSLEATVSSLMGV